MNLWHIIKRIHNGKWMVSICCCQCSDSTFLNYQFNLIWSIDHSDPEYKVALCGVVKWSKLSCDNHMGYNDKLHARSCKIFSPHEHCMGNTFIITSPSITECHRTVHWDDDSIQDSLLQYYTKIPQLVVPHVWLWTFSKVRNSDLPASMYPQRVHVASKLPLV